jgi:hypothetical protein
VAILLGRLAACAQTAPGRNHNNYGSHLRCQSPRPWQ